MILFGGLLLLEFFFLFIILLGDRDVFLGFWRRLDFLTKLGDFKIHFVFR